MRYNLKGVISSDEDAPIYRFSAWRRSARRISGRRSRTTPRARTSCSKSTRAAARFTRALRCTPWNMSATYAPLPELTDITRLDKETADAAIDAGKLILIHDGRQVKIARAVNSLTTTLLDHGAIFQKIKALEVVDRVDADFRATIEDTFIGKVLNTYDNRMLLVTAGRSYFHTLETAGLLIEDKSSLDIDTEAVRDYLGAAGDELGDEELRHADTGSHVFLVGKFTIADAIEDVTIKITV